MIIKVSLFLDPPNGEVHWLSIVLKELEDSNIHLQSLCMNIETYEMFVNIKRFYELKLDPFDRPSLCGLPVVLTRNYSWREIYFSPTFLIPLMSYGSMKDARPYWPSDIDPISYNRWKRDK